MNNPFSEAVFDMGWKLQMEIPFFGKQCKIEILAEAYSEIEKATDAQIASYDEFSRNSEGILKKVQRLLAYEAGDEKTAECRFSPVMLHISQNGNYALLFDDSEDYENGIVVTIKPELKVMASDQYL